MFLYEEFICCRNVAFMVYWSVKLIIIKIKKTNNCGNWIRAYTGLFTQVLCTCIFFNCWFIAQGTEKYIKIKRELKSSTATTAKLYTQK